MRHNFKISFIFILLNCIVLSSVLGIIQNKSAGLSEISLTLVKQDKDINNAASKTIIHETFIEKDFIYENEEEDDKEKYFVDVTLFSSEFDVFKSGLFSCKPETKKVSTVALNILYCVFLI